MPVVREDALNVNNGLDEEPPSAPHFLPLEPSDLTNSRQAHRDDEGDTPHPHVQPTTRAVKKRRVHDGNIQHDHHHPYDAASTSSQPASSSCGNGSSIPSSSLWPCFTSVEGVLCPALHQHYAMRPTSDTNGTTDSVDFDDYQFNLDQPTQGNPMEDYSGDYMQDHCMIDPRQRERDGKTRTVDNQGYA